jgi:TolA-binding protein
MSIIADTLKRLQAQPEDPPHKPSDDLVPRPAFNKGEGSGLHRKDSPFGFLMVMVGMTITLGGLAFAAFWIGGHLDFGLATDTQARVNAYRSIPKAPDLSKDPVFVDQSFEARVAAVSEPTQFPQSSTNQANNEQHQASASLGTDSSPIPPSPPHEVTTPSIFDVETINPSSTKAIVSTAPQDQQGLSQPIDQLIRNEEESTVPTLSGSKEPSSVMVSTELPTSTTDYLASDMADDGQTDKPEAPDLIAMLSEEEIIQTEELVKPSEALTDSAPRPTALAALKARRESRKHDVQPGVPLHSSATNQLGHAQQLIRSGEYEDAVALLSPLFHDPPVKWQPWFWMGTALLGKGDIEQADQFFESLEADVPQIHLNMGYAYEQLGNDRMANQYYGKFLKLSEGNPTFFATRKKLFARLTRQTPTKKSSPPSGP